MKAILEFNLEEEREDFNIASHARDLYMCLWEIKKLSREHEKYNGPPVTNKVVWDTIQDHGIGHLF